jgi:hypothetical protein
VMRSEFALAGFDAFKGRGVPSTSFVWTKLFQLLLAMGPSLGVSRVTTYFSTNGVLGSLGYTAIQRNPHLR